MTTAPILIPVHFEGHVEVHVPDHLNPAQRLALASKVALTRILATTDNPDSGDAEEDACLEFAKEHGIEPSIAEELWDVSSASGVRGIWTSAASAAPPLPG